MVHKCYIRSKKLQKMNLKQNLNRSLINLNCQERAKTGFKWPRGRKLPSTRGADWKGEWWFSGLRGCVLVLPFFDSICLSLHVSASPSPSVFVCLLYISICLHSVFLIFVCLYLFMSLFVYLFFYLFVSLSLCLSVSLSLCLPVSVSLCALCVSISMFYCLFHPSCLSLLSLLLFILSFPLTFSLSAVNVFCVSVCLSHCVYV